MCYSAYHCFFVVSLLISVRGYYAYHCLFIISFCFLSVDSVFRAVSAGNGAAYSIIAIEFHRLS